MANPIDRLRRICLALPEAHEVNAWGEPTFRVRNKLFAMYASAKNHHGAGKNAVWCKATHVDQDMLIRADPTRFFSPPYVGPSGWVGIYLDGTVDWEAIADQMRDAYRLIAPKRVLARLDSAKATAKPAKSSRKRPTKTPKPRKAKRERARKPNDYINTISPSIVSSRSTASMRRVARARID